MTHDHTFTYSTNIKRVQYESPDMFITFKQGRRYRFKNVPEDAYQALIEAPSTGKHYYEHIQGKFDYEEMK